MILCGQKCSGNVRGGLGEWPDRVERGNLALDAAPLLINYENYFSFIALKSGGLKKISLTAFFEASVSCINP